MKKINYKILFETFLKNKHPYSQHWIHKEGKQYIMEYVNFSSSWVYHLGTNKKNAINRMTEIFKGDK